MGAVGAGVPAVGSCAGGILISGEPVDWAADSLGAARRLASVTATATMFAIHRVAAETPNVIPVSPLRLRARKCQQR